MDKPAEDKHQPEDISRQIERQLRRIDVRLGRLEKAQGIEDKVEKEGKETSRLVLAGGIALVAAKLFAALGVKVGSLRGLARISKEEGKNFDLTKAFTDKRVLGPILMDGTIGAVVGGVIGGLFGWKRGNRISRPGELLSAPIKSIRTLLQSEESYQADLKKKTEAAKILNDSSEENEPEKSKLNIKPESGFVKKVAERREETVSASRTSTP